MKLRIVLSAACALMLGASAAEANPNQYKLNCTGTEPFWGVEVSGNTVKLRTPEMGANQSKSYWDARSTNAAGVPAGSGFQVQASRNRGAEKILLSVVRAPNNSCSDNMSDRKYSHHVLVSLENGTLYKGCCQPK